MSGSREMRGGCYGVGVNVIHSGNIRAGQQGGGMKEEGGGREVVTGRREEEGCD